MRIVATLKRLYTPRNIAFLLLFPINIVVPLIITSFFFGIPYPYYKINGSINIYTDTFNLIKLSEGTTQQGHTFAKVGNLRDNVKKEEERLKAIEEEESEKELKGDSTPSGEFSKTSSSSSKGDEKKVNNYCDFFAAKIISSDTEQARLSSSVLANFALTAEAFLDDVDRYSLIVSSDIKLIPINEESLIVDIEDFKVDIRKDFKLDKVSFKKPVYLMYIFADNIAKDRDPRCR